MKQRDLAKEWIEKADEDFGFASIGIIHSDYYAQICFHFQQAAEKYLKAFIVAENLKFRPIHNLIELLVICTLHNPEFKELGEACRYLNPFYIDTTQFIGQLIMINRLLNRQSNMLKRSS